MALRYSAASNEGVRKSCRKASVRCCDLGCRGTWRDCRRVWRAIFLLPGAAALLFCRGRPVLESHAMIELYRGQISRVHLYELGPDVNMSVTDAEAERSGMWHLHCKCKHYATASLKRVFPPCNLSVPRTILYRTRLTSTARCHFDYYSTHHTPISTPPYPC
jgi:hypothetical protein